MVGSGSQAIADGEERSQKEGGDCWWRGEEQSLVEGTRSGLRWRGAVSGEGERSQVEGTDRRWRGAIADGGERSQVEGSDRWWRGAVSGGGERSMVEGSGKRSLDQSILVTVGRSLVHMNCKPAQEPKA